MQDLKGSFHLLPLGDLIALFTNRRCSGELLCERGAVRKRVTIAAGAAVGAASNDPREHLGQLLINFGHVDEEQLTKAFETQQQTRVKLGKVLIMVGLATPEVVQSTLALKIRETLLDVFVWDSGHFTFDEGPPPTADEHDVSVPLADIAREAEFRRTVWQAFRAAFPSGADTLAVRESTGDAPPVANGNDPLLRLAREGKSIDEIGLALHATDFHLYQRLYALHRQGVLSPVPAVGAAPPSEAASAPELVGAARTALTAGRIAEAEILAARAVEMAPELAEAVSLLADLRVRLARMLDSLLPRVPVLRVRPGEIGKLALSSAEKYLLARCDGVRDAAQLVNIAPLSQLEVLKAVQRFVEKGIAELR